MIYKPTSFKYLSGVCLFVIGRISTLKATCFLRIQALQRKAATRCLVFWEENLSLFYLILPESPTKSRRRGRGKFSLLFPINDFIFLHIRQKRLKKFKSYKVVSFIFGKRFLHWQMHFPSVVFRYFSIQRMNIFFFFVFEFSLVSLNLFLSWKAHPNLKGSFILHSNGTVNILK